MRSSDSDLEPLELLFERPHLPRFDLPQRLLTAYGGPLGFSRPRFFANLVASVDGVVALPADSESGQIISGHSQPDRLVMGLLRSCADAVIVGAATFRKSAGHRWHPNAIYPPYAELFAETRWKLGLSEQPLLVLVSGSGQLDRNEPALRDALVVTTAAGEASVRRQVPCSEVAVLGEDRVPFTDLLALLQKRGLDRVLTEGGPSTLSQLIAEKLLDELFLTSSPALFGRFTADARKSLVDGLDLGGTPLQLLSVRRHDSHLFLRYAISHE